MKKVTKIATSKGRNIKALRVAAYCRVSTDSDKQLLSLESQKTHYENFIKANPDWKFAGLYFDEGVSGRSREKRAALLKMLDDCEKGRIDHIITKSISRFARNTTECLEMIRRLMELGISVFFEKENINTQNMDGELLLSIMSSLAQSESESISENSKWSVKHRFETGSFKCSSAPYGYTWIKEEGRLVINEEQAEVVRRIFRRALEGAGTQKIADELTKEGIPAARGSKWHSGSVGLIIKNEKYVGDCMFQKTFTDFDLKRRVNRGQLDRYYVENHHKPIITKEQYEAANAALVQRGLDKGNRAGTVGYQKRYAFSRKLQCGECGSALIRRVNYTGGGKSYIAWSCKKHLEDKSACSMKYIRNDDLELAFITMMNKLIFARERILKPLYEKIIYGSAGSNNKDTIKGIDSAIHDLEEKREILKGLMTSQIIDPDVFGEEVQEIDAEVAELTKKKKDLTAADSVGAERIGALKELLKITGKIGKQTAFDENLFLTITNHIEVESRTEIVFCLSCGLKLHERLD